jgi:hypothetical protein
VAKRKGASPQRRAKALSKASDMVAAGQFGKGQLDKISTSTLGEALGKMKRTSKHYNKVAETLMKRGDAFNGGGFR